MNDMSRPGPGAADDAVPADAGDAVIAVGLDAVAAAADGRVGA